MYIDKNDNSKIRRTEKISIQNTTCGLNNGSDNSKQGEESARSKRKFGKSTKNLKFVEKNRCSCGLGEN